MPYVLVTDFKQGLDRRRMAVASPPGTLQQAVNAHINRGGEVEKSKAWVATYALPPNTFGFEATSLGLYVFGSVAAPTMPSGVTYQRLQHPDGFAMTALVSSEVFGGQIYAIADFEGGTRLHFYNGVLVGDWYEGVVRASMTNLSGIGVHLATLLSATTGYSSGGGNPITITGPNGRNVTITATYTNGGAIDDQTVTVARTKKGILSYPEVTAVGSFTIYGGSVSAGVNTLSALTVNGVSIITGAIDYTTSNEVFAQTIANDINTKVSSPEYNAVANGAVVTIQAVAGSGATPNGFVVSATVTGNVILCTGSFTITDGTAAAGNQVTSVSVNGANITTAAVLWVTSNSATAAALVTNINANSGVSGYNAFSESGSATVLIGKLVCTGTSPSSLSLKPTSGGTLRIDDQAAAGVLNYRINTSVVNMRGGVLAYAGTSDTWVVTLGGTFDPGDKLTITSEDPTLGTVEWGASRVAGSIASPALLTHKKKMYTGIGSVLAFSGVSNPSGFDISSVGAGLIDVADEFNGSINITALAPYQSQLAIFSRRATQVWSTDPDPALNAQAQVLPNIGALAADSVRAFTDSDVFFLSDSGVRSLRARYALNSATVFDVGTPIDDIILEVLRTIPDEVAAAAFAEIEPTTGRYMLYLNGMIYVFTYFPNAKISAWSTYTPPTAFSKFVTFTNRMYARGGDTIYLLGGGQNISYDATETVVELPFLDARQAATWKSWNGLDVALEGTWDVYLATDPNNPTIEDYVGQVNATTFAMYNIPMVSDSPLLKLRFVNNTAQYARISMVIAHYMGAEVKQ
jgi:hypothetical protein